MRFIAVFATVLVLIRGAFAAEPETYEAAADGVVADWTEELGPAFRALAPLPEDAFITAWQGEYETWLARLDAAAAAFAPDPALAERYEQRILYEWAVGRLFWPSFHAEAVEQPDFSPSAGYADYLDRLDLARADLLDLEEYTFFLERYRNRQADALFEGRGNIPGDAKYLTAKLIVGEGWPAGAVRCRLEANALADWLEDNAADGLDDEVLRHAEACPGAGADALLTTYGEEIAQREGHPIVVYRRVADGDLPHRHDLEIHLYPPAGWTAGDPLQPGVVFLHGGGWFFGSWSWCGACEFFKERGMAVAQVEYRTRGRHGTDIRAAYDDTLAAIAWLRENGAQYGADPQRIAVSGFSAGAHLSLAAASLAPAGPSRPDLAVSFSGCTDLVRDPYTVRMAGGTQEARALSPLFNVSPDTPPVFMVNATEDGDCHYGAAKAFAGEAAKAGVDMEFLTQENAGHFFLRDPDRAAQTRARLDAFLTRRGF